MNYNKQVVIFALVITLLLFLVSLFGSVYFPENRMLKRISIISDIIIQAEKTIPVTDSTSLNLPLSGGTDIDTNLRNQNTVLPGDSSTDASRRASLIQFRYLHDTFTLNYDTTGKLFALYLKSKTITNFLKDTIKPALPQIMKKLYEIKHNGRGKVRIAWFGDSMIEGDLLTKTFRKRIQQYFGTFGVGFVPATSVTAGFRSTVAQNWTGDWKDENFKSPDLSAPLFLSGHTFFTSNGIVSLTDKTITTNNQPLEKSLICGYLPDTFSVTVNGQVKLCHANKKVNRLSLDSSTNNQVVVTINNPKIPVYGITSEPISGVVVDNFSFRGITGLELSRIDFNLLTDLEGENKYDLVVLEYGANLMFKPEAVDYSWYRKHIINVLARLRRAMPQTEFLIVSTADRAFLYEDKWKTAVGMDNLVKIQAELAYLNEAAFYNMYLSMGGSGTIVNWAERTPSLANKDYVHPNFLGAAVLGDLLYEAFIKDYNKMERSAGK